MNKNDILELFFKANKNFIKKNKDLITRDLSERCLCAALAHEVNKLLEVSQYSQYYCDVEYNRNKEDAKQIYKNGKLQKVTCDLIIHSRGQLEKDNLIALEMKKHRGSYKTGTRYDINSDRIRLKCLTKQVFPGRTIEYEEYDLRACVCNYDFGIMYIIDENQKTITMEIYVNEEYTQTLLINLE